MKNDKTSPKLTTQIYKDNKKIYNKKFEQKCKDNDESKKSLGVVQLGRKVTGKFTALVNVNFCPIITTKNHDLWVMKRAGEKSCKVAGQGRWLQLAERAKIQGVVFKSLDSEMTDAQMVVSLGNMFPVNLAGVCLWGVMKKWQIYEDTLMSHMLHHLIPNYTPLPCPMASAVACCKLPWTWRRTMSLSLSPSGNPRASASG